MDDAFEDIVRNYGDTPETPQPNKEFADIISRAQSLNEQIQETKIPFDHGELRREVQALNRRWNAYARKAQAELAVTGTVYLGASYVDLGNSIDDEFIEYTQEYPISFIYRPVYGIGFAALDTCELNENGTIAGEQKIVFVANVDITQEDDTEEQLFLCVVQPDNIVPPLSTETYATREDLDPMLQRHFDFTKQLVINAHDETDATLALTAAAIIPGVDMYDETEAYRVVLNECLSSSLHFDEDFPYIVEVQGEMGEQYHDTSLNEHMPVIVPERTSFLVAHLELTADWDDDDNCKLMLKGTHLKGDKPHLRIPLDSLKFIESTRDRFKDLL